MLITLYSFNRSTTKNPFSPKMLSTHVIHILRGEWYDVFSGRRPIAGTHPPQDPINSVAVALNGGLSRHESFEGHTLDARGFHGAPLFIHFLLVLGPYFGEVSVIPLLVCHIFCSSSRLFNNG